VKDLLWTNFQLTRTTGMPTTFTVDGVSIEMRKRGGIPTPTKAKKEKAKTKKGKPARRPTAKARGAKPTRAPATANRAAAARQTEPVPQ
jgi:hypothetical protein